MGEFATPTLPSGVYPTLEKGRQNLKWSKYGRIDYVSRAVSGIPNPCEQWS